MFLFWLLVVAAYGTTLAYALALASLDSKLELGFVLVAIVCVATTLLAALSTAALGRRVRSQRRLYDELDLALPGCSASETWKNRPPVERALKSVAALALVRRTGPAAEQRGYVGLPMADALRLADVEEAFLRQSRLKGPP